MSDSIVSILVILMMIVSVLGKSKKNQKKANRRSKLSSARQQRRQEMRNQMYRAVERMMTDSVGSPISLKRNNETDMDERRTEWEELSESEEGCASQPMHLHTVSERTMQTAGEGEDPCHAGGYTHAWEEETQSDSAQAEEQSRQALAQDVLRGVIMSEVLTRPCERAAMRRRRCG